MFTIELMGLPGSGKSTVIPGLIEKLNKKKTCHFYASDQAFFKVSKLYTDRPFRVILNNVPNSIGQFFLKKIYDRTIFQSEKKVEFIMKYSKAIDYILKRNTFQSMDYRDKKFIISGFLELGSIFEAIKTTSSFNDVVFFDHGFVQSSLILGSPRDSAFEIGDMKQYLELLPMPDLVVYIKADIETCYYRMLNRGKGLTFRLRDISEERVMKSLKTLDHVLDQISDFLKNKNVPIVDVSSRNTLENTISKIEEMILPPINRILRKG